MHCDLKLENVFMTSPQPNASPKIGDFDVSREQVVRQTQTTVTADGGTAVYLSPERADGRARAEPPADIYALGLVFVLALDDGRESLLKTWGERTVLDIQKLASTQCSHMAQKDLLVSMLRADPDKRPSATQCMEHPYLAVSSLNARYATAHSIPLRFDRTKVNAP